MALVRDEIAKCKRCGKYGRMQFVNHKQTQMYCELCKPIVEQEEISKAIETLIRKGVTPEMFQRFLEKRKPTPEGSEND